MSFEHSKYYCLCRVNGDNDYGWFSVESDHQTIFALKFFKKCKDVEKKLGRGIFNVFGYFPPFFYAKLVLKLNLELTNYDKYEEMKAKEIEATKI